MSKNRRRIKLALAKLKLLGLVMWAKDELPFVFRVPACRRRYAVQLRRIRMATRMRKIRVLFIVSEIAKWKEQKIYEVLAASDRFEPLVGLSDWNNLSEGRCTNEKLLEEFARAEAYFDRLRDRHVRLVRVEGGKRIVSDLSEFKPDVVYYTEPWGATGKQDPESVSRLALTVFSTYFVPNYDGVEQECQMPFHRFLYGYFCLGEYWKESFERRYRWRNGVVRFFSVGHPALDFYLGKHDPVSADAYVIYAPHFSFPHPKHGWLLQLYSTFDWNGREILDYAKRHPEFKWVFKPHPLLKWALERTGLMTSEEVVGYYEEWARIGKVCTDGSYQDIFLDSRALITDCGSFLTEYGITGRPIIHLICKDNRRVPTDPIKKIYDTFYQVHNLDEMRTIFEMVLEKHEDPQGGMRRDAIDRSGIAGVNASQNILNFLERLTEG